MSYSILTTFTYEGNTVETEVNIDWLRKKPNTYAGNSTSTYLYNLLESVFIEDLSLELGNVDDYPTAQYEHVPLLEFWFKNKSKLTSKLPTWFQQLVNESMTDYLIKLEDDIESTSLISLTFRVI